MTPEEARALFKQESIVSGKLTRARSHYGAVSREWERYLSAREITPKRLKEDKPYIKRLNKAEASVKEAENELAEIKKKTNEIRKQAEKRKKNAPFR